MRRQVEVYLEDADKTEHVDGGHARRKLRSQARHDDDEIEHLQFPLYQ